MDILFQAHSGLRYLVLLAGVVALVWFLVGWIRQKPYRPPAPAALATFAGLLDIQVLIGITMWAGGRRPERVVEHLASMIGAVVVVHLVSIIQRRRRGPTGYALPLTGVTLALVLIVIGIRALGRSIL